MSFRKEKKYRLSFSDLASVKKQLFQTGMVSLHPTRLINSCYFDNSELRLFHESEEGILPRKKFRIRWYNKSNIFTEEIKISSIEGRFKYQKKLLDIHKFYELFDITLFDKFYEEIGAPITLNKWGINDIEDVKKITNITISQRMENLELNPVPYGKDDLALLLKGIIQEK